jgi:hypothetical protein
VPGLPAPRPRDLLTDDVLGQLRGTGGAGEEALAADIGVLRAAGYLAVALPPGLGGLGCTLRQAACGQRRLAGIAPLTAVAVSAHLYWTGAAADAARSGDGSMAWLLDEAARGALFGAGHRAARPGRDLTFADPGSRCEPAPDGGYELRGEAALATLTPGCDWVAVHAITGGAGAARHDAVLAFARVERGGRCRPSYRVARVLPAGAPSDVFTTSAVGWGCAVLASVEFSAARRAFRQAVDRLPAAAGPAPIPPQAPRLAAPSPAPAARHSQEAGTRADHLDQWPVAEASLRLDGLKERIAEVTHPWPRVPEPGPDLGGQHLISVYAMRREVTEGSQRVRDLATAITTATSPVPARHR